MGVNFQCSSCYCASTADVNLIMKKDEHIKYVEVYVGVG